MLRKNRRVPEAGRREAQDETSSQVEIEHLVRAGYPLLYVVSPEEERVEQPVPHRQFK